MGETTRNTADDYDDKTTTGDGINKANEKTNRKSKHASSPHFSPDPLLPAPLSPAGLNQFPRPQVGGRDGREDQLAETTCGHMTGRASEQAGNGPLSHSRSTGAYSHRSRRTHARTRYETETTDDKTRRLCQLNFPAYPCPETPNAHDDERGRDKDERTSEASEKTRRHRTPDDMG